MQVDLDLVYVLYASNSRRTDLAAYGPVAKTLAASFLLFIKIIKQNIK